MAFLYKRANSPFWWISYRHPVEGKRVYESTGLRHANRNETRLAHVRSLEVGLTEVGAKRQCPEEAWNHWVEPFLAARYSTPEQKRTLERYRTAWRNLVPFLEGRGILFPRMLKREDLFAYLSWRQETRNERIRPCSFNTARNEIKTLGIILQEAMLRGYCQNNPARQLGLRKQLPKEKPEITAADILEIRKRLESEPDWMRVSFEISIHHGTRLRATQIDLRRDIDWTAGLVTFHEKGSRTLTVPISPAIRPMLEQLRAEGRQVTCILPKDPSKHWRRFFDAMGRPDYCFHSCRVTTVTRLARAGVSESLARRFVGHASTEIHRVYQRLGVNDLGACHLVLSAAPDAPARASTQTFKSPTESLV